MASRYEGGAVDGGGEGGEGAGGGAGDNVGQISVNETLLELFFEQEWEGAAGTLRSPSSSLVVIILSLLLLPPTCNDTLTLFSL